LVIVPFLLLHCAGKPLALCGGSQWPARTKALGLPVKDSQPTSAPGKVMRSGIARAVPR